MKVYSFLTQKCTKYICNKVISFKPKSWFPLFLCQHRLCRLSIWWRCHWQRFIGWSMVNEWTSWKTLFVANSSHLWMKYLAIKLKCFERFVLKFACIFSFDLFCLDNGLLGTIEHGCTQVELFKLNASLCLLYRLTVKFRICNIHLSIEDWSL